MLDGTNCMDALAIIGGITNSAGSSGPHQKIIAQANHKKSASSDSMCPQQNSWLARLIWTTWSYLVGGFNPVEKYESKWESSPNRGENKKCLKLPPRSYLPGGPCVDR